MDVRVGDVLTMKKQHPCGENRFLVLRSGMDFKIRCMGCGREVMVPRVKAEKNIKKNIPGGGASVVLRFFQNKKQDGGRRCLKS